MSIHTLWEETALTTHSAWDQPEIVQLNRVFTCVWCWSASCYAKTELGAIMHFDWEKWVQRLSLIKLFLNLNRCTVTVQRYALWDWEPGVSEPNTVSITCWAGIGGDVFPQFRKPCAIKSQGAPTTPPQTHTHTYTLTHIHTVYYVVCSQEVLMKLLMIFMCAVACKQGPGLPQPAGRSVSASLHGD